MGFALFVTFEREISGIEGWKMCGKSLAANIEELDRIATRLKLEPLGNMISISPEDMESLLGEDADEEDEPINPPPKAAGLMAELEKKMGEIDDSVRALKAEGMPVEQWFSPTAALKTVRGLLSYVRDNSRGFKQSFDPLDDLVELERYLAVAEKERVRFHLTPDF